MPDLTIWYGPDTYMGENIYNMLLEMRQMDDEQIRAVHPAHTQVREIELALCGWCAWLMGC